MATAGDLHQDDFYELTGQLIRGWTKLELLLLQWLNDLLGIDELRSRIVWETCGSLPGKVHLLRVLVRNFADERLWASASSILTAVEKIAENRYILPHAFGEVNDARTALSFRSERPDEDFVIDFTRERRVDTDVLKGWLQEIDRSQQAISAVKRELAGAVHQESLKRRGAQAPISGAS